MSVLLSLRKKINYESIFVVAGFFIIASFLLFLPNDPDLFWHLRLSLLTIQNGPLHTNEVSFMYPDFKFIDYEWLSHVLMYPLFLHFGYWGLSIVFAGIITICLLLVTQIQWARKKSSEKIVTIFLISFALFVMRPIIGVRVQMITVLFLTLLFYLVFQYYKTQNNKILAIIPLLFFLWANMHGGFLIGFIFLGAVIAAEISKNILTYLKSRWGEDIFPTMRIKPLVKLVIVSCISFGITFLNPYGYHNVMWVITNATDSNALRLISEWQSPDFHTIFGKAFFLYVGIVIVSIIKRKKTGVLELLLLSGFLTIALQSVRHIPLFIFISIPSICATEWNISIPFSKLQKKLMGCLLLFIGMGMFFLSLGNFIYTMSSVERIYEMGGYPIEAVKFLKENPKEGNMFNKYGWGGFLTLELPEKKTFINGLMTSWSEGDSAILEEYTKVINLDSPDWRKSLDKYDIKLVFIDKKEPLANALYYDSDWHIVYQDEVAVIYQRN